MYVAKCRKTGKYKRLQISYMFACFEKSGEMGYEWTDVNEIGRAYRFDRKFDLLNCFYPEDVKVVKVNQRDRA